MPRAYPFFKPFRKPRWTGSPNSRKKRLPVLIFWREPGATFLGLEAIPKVQEKCNFKGALDKFNIIPNFFPKNVGIFIPLEMLAWVKTAFYILDWTYFWRNMNISSIFYFSKLTSMNTQYSSLWGHSEDDAVYKIAHKMKTHWQNQLKFSVLVWF